MAHGSPCRGSQRAKSRGPLFPPAIAFPGLPSQLKPALDDAMPPLRCPALPWPSAGPPTNPLTRLSVRPLHHRAWPWTCDRPPQHTTCASQTNTHTQKHPLALSRPHIAPRVGLTQQRGTPQSLDSPPAACRRRASETNGTELAVRDWPAFGEGEGRGGKERISRGISWESPGNGARGEDGVDSHPSAAQPPQQQP